MNLLEPKDLKREHEVSLRLKRSTLIEPTARRLPSGAIALIAGAAAFMLTASLIATVKKVRQTREIKRYFSGETTDRLAASADAIVHLIERESGDAVAQSGYPASLLLELEREQHRMVEAYGSLYRTLGAKEQSELIEPKQLLIFNGIAAFEALPVTEEAAQSDMRFITDTAQMLALDRLYTMCLHIRELASGDNRASYSAERSERSAARLLTSIGQQPEA
ncbi:hypothetical protein [Saccharibacillus sacchari]|uniref:Uncharacterized protein n=1 Tax=Saccharibacillus sacchari TaxID=456493 RepID=A0ACC6PJZ8_9BACL